jgi:CRISPR/Cas system CSM-associated protein Csm3 (group 7 of RAMP superfamily)
MNPLNDAMSPRPLTARWVLCGTLTLETALHLGGEGGEQVDMPVLRDLREGRPLLPGTTLAGALRSALADRLAGYGAPEPPEVGALFGSTRGDDGSQSALIVFDSLGTFSPDSPDQGVEIRDGVAISPATGTAEDHKKYDFEVLPAGTTFNVRIDLLLPSPAGIGEAEPIDEKSLLECLAAALDAFSNGQGAFGAKRSRGLGRVRAAWAARRFDLRSPAGWRTWVLSDHTQPLGAKLEQVRIYDAIKQAAPENLQPLTLLGDRRTRIVIDLNLKLDHDILVRSPGTAPGAPDVSHLHSGGKAVLPGTSLAGVMRAQALRIARLVRGSQQDAERWVDRLFGPRFEGQRPIQKLEPRASRLRVGEAMIENSNPQCQTRIAIDRFTGGTVDTALFDEQTNAGGQATVQLELRNPEEGELGLVLLVLKDLLDGSLPVGGTSSIGRGFLCGDATVTWYEGGEATPISAHLQPKAPPSGNAARKVEEAIRAFHQASLLTMPAMNNNVEGSI